MLRLATRAITVSALFGMAVVGVTGPTTVVEGVPARLGGSDTMALAPVAQPSPRRLDQPQASPIRVAESSLDDRIAEVQRMLKRQGFDPGPVDGKLGLRTRDAIRAYQSLVRAQENADVPDAAETLNREKGPPTPRVKPTIDAQ